MLAETVAEVGAAAETAVSGNLYDGALRLVDQQMGGIFEAQLQNKLVEPDMLAALGEDGSHALLRQLEAVYDGLTAEVGIEEKALLHDHLVDMQEELFVGEFFQIVGNGGWFRCLRLFLCLFLIPSTSACN